MNIKCMSVFLLAFPTFNVAMEQDLENGLAMGPERIQQIYNTIDFEVDLLNKRDELYKPYDKAGAEAFSNIEFSIFEERLKAILLIRAKEHEKERGQTFHLQRWPNEDSGDPSNPILKIGIEGDVNQNQMLGIPYSRIPIDEQQS